MAEKNNDVPAINKMNLIFDLLASEPKGLSQSSICNNLNLSKATVSRLINTLSGMGYLEQSGNGGTFMLGPKLLSLGNIVNKRLDISVISAPVIEKLSNQIDEMVKVSVMRGDVVYPVQSCESKKAIRITLDSSTVFPPYIGAAGKLLLALSYEGQRYYEHTLPTARLVANTEKTVTDRSVLENILEEIKISHIAYDKQEESDGIYAIASPVYDSNSHVIAAVSIPFFGDFESKKKKYLPLLEQCTNEISRNMGCVGENIE